MRPPKRRCALRKEKRQEWEVLNPSGSIEVRTATPAPRLTTLEGKTVLLRWNFKHNGNRYLDRIAECLTEKVPSARVIKLINPFAIPAPNAKRIASPMKGD